MSCPATPPRSPVSKASPPTGSRSSRRRATSPCPMTRSLARALAPEVRVNAVAPGLVETPLTQSWSQTRKRTTLARTLLARLAQPEDIAEAMLYLAAGAAYMTGQTIVLDGGTV